MSDLDQVQVKYLRPICGWRKGQVRTCDRYIADSLCAEPRPNAEWITTNEMPQVAIETRAKPVPVARKPFRRRSK